MEDRERIRFLENAYAAVKELSGQKAVYSETQQKYKDSERALEALRKTIEKEKETILRTNRADVEAKFDKLIRWTESERGKAETQRKDARNAAVKDRIREETAGLVSANKFLKLNISRILKEKDLPSCCASGLFLCMYAPRGFGEQLIRILVFLITLVGIPFSVSLFPEEPWQKAAAAAAAALLAIGLYFLIRQKVAVPGREGLLLVHDETDKIRANRKQIAKIRKSVRKDRDDSRYDLSRQDEEISRISRQKNEIAANKQQALSEFESVTSVKLKDEVDAAYAAELAEKIRETEQLRDEMNRYAEQILKMEQEINTGFTQYLGEKNMTLPALEEQIGILKEELAEKERQAAAAEAAKEVAAMEAAQQAAAETAEQNAAAEPAQEEAAARQPAEE